MAKRCAAIAALAVLVICQAGATSAAGLGMYACHAATPQRLWRPCPMPDLVLQDRDGGQLQRPSRKPQLSAACLPGLPAWLAGRL